MEPQNKGLEDDFPFQRGDFRFHVSLLGSTPRSPSKKKRVEDEFPFGVPVTFEWRTVKLQECRFNMWDATLKKSITLVGSWR